MSRAQFSYASGRAIDRAFTGIDVSEPTEGYYRHRLVFGGVRGGVHIWYGPPHDPDTGDEMDRSWRWQAEFDGDYIELDRVWPDCAGEPISEADYRAYCNRKAWARQNAPNSAFANRRQRRDPLSIDCPLPF
ncbi:hypothetical protein GRI97_08240 [Altererythrobacter xixiisoli]|uniref:Uncharacterized protein n=1 Tax=Croceibacterium xixiisoli TaxID=1476466 RepID=A0A6I4TSQ6_9SPHN|nr:hypothetical protein [Croceibacterium xixiisoli]MXO98976.1 hypothetical protein [Croceibacterium xixiisoli]